jgi:hypothetical protein
MRITHHLASDALKTAVSFDTTVTTLASPPSNPTRKLGFRFFVFALPPSFPSPHAAPSPPGSRAEQHPSDTMKTAASFGTPSPLADLGAGATSIAAPISSKPLLRFRVKPV